MPRLNLDKCGTESGCITYPADCTAETCIFTISYAATVNGIRFRLLSKQAQSQHSYVGMGISSDQKMVKPSRLQFHILPNIFLRKILHCNRELY